MISRPLRKWISASRCTLVTSGQVASRWKRLRAPRRRRHRLGDAVGGEDHRLVGLGDLVELLDEDGALRLQALDDIAVMHDLVAHIDGRAVAFERELDDLDGPLDAGAEAARAAEEDVEMQAWPSSGREVLDGATVQRSDVFRAELSDGSGFTRLDNGTRESTPPPLPRRRCGREACSLRWRSSAGRTGSPAHIRSRAPGAPAHRPPTRRLRRRRPCRDRGRAK